MNRAVVFAYHNVGVRCLKALLAGGVDVGLVVTHTDNPAETIWYDSVNKTAREYGLPCIAPDDPNTEAALQQVRAVDADYLFSFYYRQMLKSPLLACAPRGAFNLHGSLLPKYRGRAPVNWAIIHGETETGATLHLMNEKPDNGALVDQLAVPILPDDSAQEVFGKVTVAAEIVLVRSLPALLNGTAKLTPQDLSQGAYFGGRTADDGRIDWRQSARNIHNLVRAVTKPFPGAFSEHGMGRLTIWKTRVMGDIGTTGVPGLYLENELMFAICGDGKGLQILDAELDGKPLDATHWRRSGLPPVLALTRN